MIAISSFWNPLEVIAGDPKRIPLVINGFSVSLGTVFLLQVMFT